MARPEGKALEFRRDLSSPDGVLRGVVGFANAAGGTLLIGAVRPKQRCKLPPVALREAIINAVAYADYARRPDPPVHIRR